MLRRSDFIAATYALSLVFANFGIAIAARMPMMTTTIRSSISVKPFLVLIEKSPEIRLVTASRCRHHSKDGTVRSTATGYMAGSGPKTAAAEYLTTITSKTTSGDVQ